MPKTSSPRWLKRVTIWATASRLKPAACPAAERVAPAATHRSALARLTVSTRSLVALATRCNSCSSAFVTPLRGSFTRLPIACVLLTRCFFSVSHISFPFASYLPVDPLEYYEHTHSTPYERFLLHVELTVVCMDAWKQNKARQHLLAALDI